MSDYYDCSSLIILNNKIVGFKNSLNYTVILNPKITAESILQIIYYIPDIPATSYTAMLRVSTTT